ncbi:hypothetical protein KO02_15095 [Sphingobacterium sp. ML3W]|uniref:hypothetical protein n=1 Tax=Sphingobacterium sp. ML3W TaxID=1538644 RepID=UPI0004F6A6C4|nr:hypothetical protein [Sphingobacterium sp. ML3W]AIM37864.1 hypothetical protein KO02_15095 [Sphingobacterium sp. ML3W]
MSNYIKELKEDLTVNRWNDKDGNSYGIRVLGRGESLFFQENEKALLCDIDAAYAIIYVKSIKNWEGEKKMNVQERGRVIALIEKYYKEVYNPGVELHL